MSTVALPDLEKIVGRRWVRTAPAELDTYAADGLPTRFSRPGAVVLPGWTVTFVAQVRDGAHPSYALGYSVRDNDYYVAWDAIARDRETFTRWLRSLGGDDPPQTPPAHGGAARPPMPPWARLRGAI